MIKMQNNYLTIVKNVLKLNQNRYNMYVWKNM